MKQVFGYTQPESAKSGEYVKFIQVFKYEPDDSVMISVRDETGKITSFDLSTSQRIEFACAIIEDHDRILPIGERSETAPTADRARDEPNPSASGGAQGLDLQWGRDVLANDLLLNGRSIGAVVSNDDDDGWAYGLMPWHGVNTVTGFFFEEDARTALMSAARAWLSPLSQAELQDGVAPWMQECFGPVIAADKLERGDRLLEEVLELLQSGDYPRERIAALTDYTYNRPKGEPAQEVGGVMVTLAAYCLAHGLNMHDAGRVELARITKPEIIAKIRAKQATKPTGSALPVALSQASDTVSHQWHERFGLTCCKVCGFVKNDNSDTRGCRGPVYVSLRDDAPASDTVAVPKADVEWLINEFSKRHFTGRETAVKHALDRLRASMEGK